LGFLRVRHGWRECAVFVFRQNQWDKEKKMGLKRVFAFGLFTMILTGLIVAGIGSALSPSSASV